MDNTKIDLSDKRRTPRECLPLIQSTHINIYHENTFRITGLPVDASEREIKKHAEILKLIAEGYGEVENRGAFALDPLPSVDQIREAIQRLKEPEQRLIDEFFWFWPQEFGKSAHDPAIQAILSGDRETAYEIWAEWETDSTQNYIAWHNIAVMFHLVALDWTRYHISSEVDEAREEKIKGYWKESFSRWEKVAADDRIWDTLKTRIRTLDDARLTTGFARRMRGTLPEALGKINAEIALKFANQGRTVWAEIHIGFTNETNQGFDDAEKTAELVLTPTRKRVLMHIKTARKECDKSPKNGANAARKLVEQCAPLQSLFELFYGSDSHRKTELFDEVANTINNCAAAYQRKTADNEAFLSLLKESLSFATAADIRQRIRENIDIGEGNLRREPLNPIYKELTKIQESKENAKSRLAKMKNAMMPLLANLIEKEGSESKIVTRLSDSYAMVLRGISIDAHNDENDYATASEAIRLAEKLAKNSDSRIKIIGDLKTVKEHLKDSMCYYCSKNIGVAAYAIKISMFGDVHLGFGMSGNRLTQETNYRHIDILVPRFTSCKTVQNNQYITSCAIWIMTIILGIGIGAASGDDNWLAGAFVGFFIGLGGFAITKQFMRILSNLKSTGDYPKIRELRSQGWKYGKKPE